MVIQFRFSGMRKTLFAIIFGLILALPAAAKDYSFEGGTVSIDSLGVAGSTVTIKAVADSGYVLHSVSVTDTSGEALPLVEDSAGVYHFTMPAMEISINVVFQPYYSIGTSGAVDSTAESYSISVSGKVDSTAALSPSKMRLGSSMIAASGSALRIATNKEQMLRVYGVNGRLVKAQSVPAGETSINGLPSGVYMVKLSDGTKASVGIK